MNRREWSATLTLALVYGLRMLGMFMVLPVFSPYAATLSGGAAAWQIGLALGVYGLTQALLQIPLGMLSDRIGRLPVILAGMAVFAAGSWLAGSAQTIEGVTIGRAVQGGGAISAAATALLADITRESVRTQAMAILGAGMGGAFVLALILGPVLAGPLGVNGLFHLTAVLAALTLPLILFSLPRVRRLPAPDRGGFRRVLTDRRLLQLDAGILLLHASLTASFVILPFILRDTLRLAAVDHWRVYLPVMGVAVLCVFPLIRFAGQGRRASRVFAGAVAALAAGLLFSGLGHAQAPVLLMALTVYFIAFSYLEGALPSLISRQAPASARGAALGVYATAQFLGAFAGGTLGGVALGRLGAAGACLSLTLLPLLWLGFAGRTGGLDDKSVPG